MCVSIYKGTRQGGFVKATQSLATNLGFTIESSWEYEHQKSRKTMSIVLNSNTTAATAAFHLNNAHSNMEKALVRLSSGKRINNPSDDAGGLAVSYKI